MAGKCPSHPFLSNLRAQLRYQDVILKEATSRYLLSFQKALNFFSHQLHSKIMVKFCYFRLYLGIDTVSCFLLPRMARMNVD